MNIVVYDVCDIDLSRYLTCSYGVNLQDILGKERNTDHLIIVVMTMLVYVLQMILLLTQNLNNTLTDWPYGCDFTWIDACIDYTCYIGKTQNI